MQANTLRMSCRVLLACLVLAIVPSAATAQCEPRWLPQPLPGANNIVRASTVWDPDGAGPAAPKLVLGGQFTIAGPILASRIVTWDGSAWSSLGAGLNGIVYALAASPSGELFAGGGFSMSGGTPVSRVARWNGSEWSPLGESIDFRVLALAVLPNGDLIAGGDFRTVDGQTMNHVARWDGASWSPLAGGLSSHVLAPRSPQWRPDRRRELLIAERLAQLHRSLEWCGMDLDGTGMNSTVTALAALPNGDIVAAGRLRTQAVRSAGSRLPLERHRLDAHGRRLGSGRVLVARTRGWASWRAATSDFPWAGRVSGWPFGTVHRGHRWEPESVPP